MGGKNVGKSEFVQSLLSLQPRSVWDSGAKYLKVKRMIIQRKSFLKGINIILSL